MADQQGPQPDSTDRQTAAAGPAPVAGSKASAASRWVAIITGAISILIAVLYLLLITVLDSRGPMRPPPPEALGFAPAVGAAGAPGAVGAVPLPGSPRF